MKWRIALASIVLTILCPLSIAAEKDITYLVGTWTFENQFQQTIAPGGLVTVLMKESLISKIQFTKQPVKNKKDIYQAKCTLLDPNQSKTAYKTWDAEFWDIGTSILLTVDTPTPSYLTINTCIRSDKSMWYSIAVSERSFTSKIITKPEKSERTFCNMIGTMTKQIPTPKKVTLDFIEGYWKLENKFYQEVGLRTVTIAKDATLFINNIQFTKEIASQVAPNHPFNLYKAFISVINSNGHYEEYEAEYMIMSQDFLFSIKGKNKFRITICTTYEGPASLWYSTSISMEGLEEGRVKQPEATEDIFANMVGIMHKVPPPGNANEAD